MLAGVGRRLARTGRLSQWGVEQLRHRIAWLTEQAEPGADISRIRLTYRGDVGNECAVVSSAQTMRRVLEAAGLAGEPQIRPGSVSAAIGHRIWKNTRDLTLVAHALGCRSFDAAARQIGLTTGNVPSNADEDISAAVLDRAATTRVSTLRGATR